jgi:predicted membrane protein
MIDYVVGGDKGQLWIEQPEVGRLGLESYRYEWDIRLNDDVPMTLDVGLGAGESKLDVSALSISELDLNVGVGGVEVDLTGEREKDVDVTIRGGVGEAKVLLPQDVGVKARVDGGLGEVDARGLTAQDGVYVNEAYGKSDATITLSIEGGIGGVTLKVVD